MTSKKRKLDEMEIHLCNNSTIYFDPNSIPLICYQLIFQYLPIESLISASLTCKTWYTILSSNRLCYNRNTKLALANENQLIAVSNSRVLRHIKQLELGKYERGLSINTSVNFEFYFTSLQSLKLCFISLSPSFVTSLFECISPTLQKLILAIQPHSKSNFNEDLANSTTSCILILSSLHLLPNLIYFFILVTSSLKIEFSIEKHFKSLNKLEKLVIRQDNYTWKRNRIEQLNALASLPNLKHFEWFDIISNDLKILSSISARLQLQYIHLGSILITNEILYYLSQIPTINSIKSHRFSPIKAKLNINGFRYLLSLKNTLKELQISAKNIIYNELTIIQYPAETDCTEDEYEVHLNSEYIDLLKQFIHLRSLSLIKINITTEDLDNLLIYLAQYKNLKILEFESICFPSLTILSTIDSLEELSLSYLYNSNRQEYTDKDLCLLSPLKNLKVLILYYSMNLSGTLRKQLKRSSSSTDACSNPLFEHLEEFIYNNDDNEDECDDH